MIKLLSVLAFAFILSASAFAQVVPAPTRDMTPNGAITKVGAAANGAVSAVLHLFGSAGTCPTGSIITTYTVPAGGLIITEMRGRAYLQGVGYIGLTVSYIYPLADFGNSNQIAAGAQTTNRTENWGGATLNLAAGTVLTTTANCTPGLYGQWDVYGYLQ